MSLNDIMARVSEQHKPTPQAEPPKKQQRILSDRNYNIIIRALRYYFRNELVGKSSKYAKFERMLVATTIQRLHEIGKLDREQSNYSKYLTSN